MVAPGWCCIVVFSRFFPRCRLFSRFSTLSTREEMTYGQPEVFIYRSLEPGMLRNQAV